MGEAPEMSQGNYGGVEEKRCRCLPNAQIWRGLGMKRENKLLQGFIQFFQAWRLGTLSPHVEIQNLVISGHVVTHRINPGNHRRLRIFDGNQGRLKSRRSPTLQFTLTPTSMVRAAFGNPSPGILR